MRNTGNEYLGVRQVYIQCQTTMFSEKTRFIFDATHPEQKFRDPHIHLEIDKQKSN